MSNIQRVRSNHKKMTVRYKKKNNSSGESSCRIYVEKLQMEQRGHFFLTIISSFRRLRSWKRALLSAAARTFETKFVRPTTFTDNFNLYFVSENPRTRVYV